MQIIQQQPLRAYNTLKLNAQAKRFLVLEHESDVARLPRIPIKILGGGSNIVLTSDIDAIAHVAFRGKRIVRSDKDSVYIEVGAGENWHDWVAWTLEEGLSGLENLSLIPGSVGAAPVQNIGAYGVEAGDRIESVRYVDLTSGESKALSAADCAFAYRHSIFKGALKHRALITHVVFRLDKHFQANVRYAPLQHLAHKLALGAQDVAQEVIRLRQSKLPDPAVLGNVGSFFHNPVVTHAAAQSLLQQHADMPHYPVPNGVKLAAGWLIEKAGLKGYAIGDAAVYERQALVLVNRHEARAQDIVALAQHVQAAVQQKFDIKIEPEPDFWP